MTPQHLAKKQIFTAHSRSAYQLLSEEEKVVRSSCLKIGWQGSDTKLMWTPSLFYIMKTGRSKKQTVSALWRQFSKTVDQNTCKLSFKKYLLCYSEGHEEFHAKVENLNPTEDGEASEESHGAADKAELACQSDLSVSLYLIVG